jgi:hypothetical protein
MSASVEAGKDAARRRREELAEELARRDDRLALRTEPPSAEPEAPAATAVPASPTGVEVEGEDLRP